MEFIICKKLTFCTRAAAKRFLRKRSLQYVQSSYPCDKCGYYHNTSLNAEGRRLIKEFNSKGK